MLLCFLIGIQLQSSWEFIFRIYYIFGCSESIQYINPITILYLAAISILDTIVVMIRRIRKGLSPFSPDKTHIHHILFKFFEDHVKKTVVFLVLLQILFSSIGYMIMGIINEEDNILAPFIAIVGFVLMFVLFYMIFTVMKERQMLFDRKELE